MPMTPSTVNHTTMIGLNTLAMPAVPRCWMANRTMRMITAIGITHFSNAGVATSKPSTADSTEMAGVISPSPYSNAVPNTPSVTTPAATLDTVCPSGRDHQRRERQDSALAVVVGPHHRGQVLDADDDHERPERDRGRTEGRGLSDRQVGVVERFAERVDRAGTDVTEHDAQGAEREQGDTGRMLGVLAHKGATLPAGRPDEPPFAQEPAGRILVPLAGIGPATHGLGNRCSIH